MVLVKWDYTHKMAPSILNTMVPHLCLYLRYWWNQVNFLFAVITFDIRYVKWWAMWCDELYDVVSYVIWWAIQCDEQYDNLPCTNWRMACASPDSMIQRKKIAGSPACRSICKEKTYGKYHLDGPHIWTSMEKPMAGPQGNPTLVKSHIDQSTDPHTFSQNTYRRETNTGEILFGPHMKMQVSYGNHSVHLFVHKFLWMPVACQITNNPENQCFCEKHVFSVRYALFSM